MLTHQTDYLDDAQAKNLEQFRDKPRYAALLASYIAEVQAVEDALWQLWSSRQLQNASALFPVVLTISTTGVLGTMQFTYSVGGGPSQGPVTSGAASGGSWGWHLPDSPFFLAFPDVNYSSTAWSWSISSAGVVTASGGAVVAPSIPSGDLLAKLGKIVGQSSCGLVDPLYLLLIMARIATNKANGRRGELASLAAFFVAPGTTIYCKDLAGPGFLVEPLGPVLVPPAVAFFQFLAAAVSAGVLLAFVWTSSAWATTLVGGSIYAPGFAPGPPATGTGVLAGQVPGSIHAPGFAAGPPASNDGGAALPGVLQKFGGP